MKPIVVGTDGSPTATLAVRRAAQLARDGGTQLHIVTAIPDVSLSEPLASSARVDVVDLGPVADSVLIRAEREVAGDDLEIVRHVESGDPAHVILDVAQAIDAELIVVGARGLTGFQRFLLGSVSAKLSHYADRSVLVVREPGE
jgi:nucleotide-binding universal stress UspA family protein